MTTKKITIGELGLDGAKFFYVFWITIEQQRTPILWFTKDYNYLPIS